MAGISFSENNNSNDDDDDDDDLKWSSELISFKLSSSSGIVSTFLMNLALARMTRRRQDEFPPLTWQIFLNA